jgi:hypothetical protein
MEQISKTDRKPFAHMKKPCSMRMEHYGTCGTKPILLTPDNKFAQLQHHHHHLHRELSSKNSHQKKPLKKRATKKPLISQGSAKPLRVIQS